MPFCYSPLADALALAGAQVDPKADFLYQDYLYQLMASGSSEKPVTEQQWEMICDIQAGRRLMYASNVNQIIKHKKGE